MASLNNFSNLSGTLNYPIGDFLDNLVPNIRNSLSEHRRRNRKDIPVDIVNEGKYIYVYAEIPGVPENKVDLNFYNNTITIICDKPCPYEDSISTDIKTEITYGRLEKSVTLPICVTRSETVTASFSNGVLCIKINKLIEEANKFSVRINDTQSGSQSGSQSSSQNNVQESV